MTLVTDAYAVLEDMQMRAIFDHYAQLPRKGSQLQDFFAWTLQLTPAEKLAWMAYRGRAICREQGERVFTSEQIQRHWCIAGHSESGQPYSPYPAYQLQDGYDGLAVLIDGVSLTHVRIPSRTGLTQMKGALHLLKMKCLAGLTEHAYLEAQRARMEAHR